MYLKLIIYGQIFNQRPRPKLNSNGWRTEEGRWLKCQLIDNIKCILYIWYIIVTIWFNCTNEYQLRILPNAIQLTNSPKTCGSSLDSQFQFYQKSVQTINIQDLKHYKYTVNFILT